VVYLRGLSGGSGRCGLVVVSYWLMGKMARRGIADWGLGIGGRGEVSGRWSVGRGWWSAVTQRTRPVTRVKERPGFPSPLPILRNPPHPWLEFTIFIFQSARK
jgi:hypothetical protein